MSELIVFASRQILMNFLALNIALGLRRLVGCREVWDKLRMKSFLECPCSWHYKSRLEGLGHKLFVLKSKIALRHIVFFFVIISRESFVRITPTIGDLLAREGILRAQGHIS